MKNYDIIIIGGGMVGLACAAMLENTPLKIAIIENKMPNFQWDDGNYDLRVSAINVSSIKLFKQLGIWYTMLKQRISPYEKISVWVDHSELNFDSAEANQSELGVIIENRVIRKTLWEKVKQQNNIEILCPMTLNKVEITDDIAIVGTNEQQILQTKLLIGADGANSWLRKQFNLPLKIHDYRQHALVTIVRTELIHQKTAWQCFLPDGPLALLPLTDQHHCSIVWSTTPKKAEYLKMIDETTFNQEITKAFNEKLGKIHIQSPRVTFPLIMQHLKNYVSKHLAFIGDAAHRIHPLAGQGVNLGFMDAHCLTKNIKQAVENQKSFFDLVTLHHYQRERKYYNSKMIILMDILKNSFQTKYHILAQLRNIGIDKVEQWNWLKRFIIQQAS